MAKHREKVDEEAHIVAEEPKTGGEEALTDAEEGHKVDEEPHIVAEEANKVPR